MYLKILVFIFAFITLAACASQPNPTKKQPESTLLLHETFEPEIGIRQIEIQNLLGNTKIYSSPDDLIHIRAKVHVFNPGSLSLEELTVNTRVLTTELDDKLLVWASYPESLKGKIFYPYSKHRFHRILFGSGSLHSTEYQGQRFQLITPGNSKTTHLRVDLDIALPTTIAVKLTQQYGHVELTQLDNNIKVDGNQLWIKSHSHQGSLHANIKRGDIRLLNFKGEAHLQTLHSSVSIEKLNLTTRDSKLIEMQHPVSYQDNLEASEIVGVVDVHQTEENITFHMIPAPTTIYPKFRPRNIEATTLRGNIDVYGSVKNISKIKLNNNRGDIVLDLDDTRQCHIRSKVTRTIKSNLAFTADGLSSVQYIPDDPSKCYIEINSFRGQLLIL